MGVVHKLRDDVVDFILVQKKARPDISVRKLSDVVFREFQVVVSKSSVGSVLKNANLNSPIGRHGYSVDEELGSAKKTAGKFAIPEQKKKQIFIPHKINPPAPPPAPSKVVKIEQKPIVKLPPRESKTNIIVESLPAEGEEEKPAPVMSNLQIEKKIAPKPVKNSFDNAGMIFLKAAEWDFAGGSVLAKIFKDELRGRFDVNCELLADLLIFPELFNQKTYPNGDSREIERLFSEDEKNDILNPQIYSSVMAAVNNIQDCGVKLSIEMEVLLRGVATVKIVNNSGNTAIFKSSNKMIDFDNVQSEVTEEVSVAEAVRGINIDISKNVHSAVFQYYSKANKINLLLNFLFSAFGDGQEGGIKEVACHDASEIELVKYTYFPVKKRNFVLADWAWKERWPRILNLAGSGAVFKAMPVLGKTFYYKEISGSGLFDTKKALPGVILVSSSPQPTEEPLVVLLINVGGDDHANQNAVLDFLYSWPGFGEETGPVFTIPKTGKKDVFSNALKDLEPEFSLPQSLTRLRKAFDIWAQQYFFAVKDNFLDAETMQEQFYRLPGHVRDENDRAAIVTLEVPAAYAYLDQLKSATHRFNARMFRDSSGRRIFMKVSAPF